MMKIKSRNFVIEKKSAVSHRKKSKNLPTVCRKKCEISCQATGINLQNLSIHMKKP